jgi:hypothetical protein
LEKRRGWRLVCVYSSYLSVKTGLLTVNASRGFHAIRPAPENPLVVEIRNVNAELFAYLKKHPDSLHTFSPRQFEEVIAEILQDMGCEVELTPQTRDGG